MATYQIATSINDQTLAVSGLSSSSSSYGKGSFGFGLSRTRLSSASSRNLIRYPIHTSWKATATAQSADPAKPAPAKTVQREIPGGYGLPLLGAISDRLDFFWFQGADKFFHSRVEQYKSTVFRVNMPPGPPFFPDSRVIVLLDQQSFPVLFDNSKVSKRDVFTGTYMPSTDFTGGYRILAYLDVDEPRHAQLKTFCLDMLKSRAKSWIPEMEFAAGRCFDSWERDLRDKKQAELESLIEDLCLSFLTRALLNHDATAAGAGAQLTVDTIKKWILPQIAPVADLPPVMELLHTIPLPFALFEASYQSITSFFSAYGTALLDLAATHGVPRDEALHNLIFIVCFNTFGGLIRLLPSALEQMSKCGIAKELSDEVAAAVRNAGGKITARALDDMPLLHSFVYEVLRFGPPVPYQYGRARHDLVIESQKEAFRVKKGEMLCGFQPIATRDPVVFDRPNEFLPRRFMGDDGQKLLKFVVWSNGPESEQPTVGNKQCAGKDFIIFVTRLFLALFLLRYESLQLEGKRITSLKTRQS